jgi:allantoinase
MSDRVGTIVVRGGLAVLPDREDRLDVVVSDGRIVELTPAGQADTTGAVIVDAGDLIVLPGAIDPHVHFEEPGREEWEGFDTGSAAAAAGGVTTVVDMPLECDPPTTTAERVAAKANAAQRHSRIDVAMWGGLVPDSVPHLDEMLDAGVVGFKAFACPSGMDAFPPVDGPTLEAGFAAAARAGRPVALHAELTELGHTVESEVEAVRWAAGLALGTGARLHVVHVSAADAVAEAVRHPLTTVETCPHYLLLDEDDVAKIGANALCSPPIRSAANREELWKAIHAGSITCVASDHSPCPDELKRGDPPWAGITGVETLVPSLLSSGRLSLVELGRLITGAAPMLGLAHKGAIALGCDADLALVDPEAEWLVRPEALWNRHRRSALTGRRLRGLVQRTYVRGRCVFDIETGPCPAGGGVFVTPTATANASAPVSRPA